jgi:hypothetical protein
MAATWNGKPKWPQPGDWGQAAVGAREAGEESAGLQLDFEVKKLLLICGHSEHNLWLKRFYSALLCVLYGSRIWSSAFGFPF